MEALEAIFTRRSIRKYKSEPVTKEEVETLLRAAMAAPSSRNKQPWRFIVIDDRNILDSIPRFHEYAKMLHEAQVAILVCGDRSVQPLDGYLALDCAAATQNILLAAHAMGLGAVWVASYPREERMKGFAEVCGLPEHIVPIALVSIGRPAETKPPSSRFDPAKVHHNRFGIPYAFEKQA